MSERLDAIESYMKAKADYDRAKMILDLAKEDLKEFGSFSESGATCDISVITKETISLKDLKEQRPELIKDLRDAGIIKKSESERLTVRVKEENDHV
jgi:hypothetical protein